MSAGTEIVFGHWAAAGFPPRREDPRARLRLRLGRTADRGAPGGRRARPGGERRVTALGYRRRLRSRAVSAGPWPSSRRRSPPASSSADSSFSLSRGEVVADAGFGEARPGEPMRRDHLMLWMSSTKPVAAVAICQLWERGRLELDDPVARHIPEFAQGGKESVTVRHLLTHTGGIRMLDTGWPAAGWDGIVARVCAQRLEPRWEPGRKAGYHLASSWFILGELVRRLDGGGSSPTCARRSSSPSARATAGSACRRSASATYGSRIAPMFDVAGPLPRPRRGRGEATPARSSAPAAQRSTTGRRPRPASSFRRRGGTAAARSASSRRLYRMLLAGGTSTGRRLLRRETVEALAARHRVGMIDATFRARLDWGLGVIVNSAHYGEPEMPYGYGPLRRAADLRTQRRPQLDGVRRSRRRARRRAGGQRHAARRRSIAGASSV